MSLNQSDPKWRRLYELCAEYEQGYGIIYQQTKFENEKIGQWLYDQKFEYQSKQLSDIQKIDLLKKLKSWITPPKEDIWKMRYQICLRYEEVYNVIKCNDKIGHFNIGAWLRDQAYKFRRGKLTREQIKLLNSLRSWTLKRTLADIWKEKYDLCVEYENTENKIVVISTKFKGVNIGAWLSKQRYAFNRKTLSKYKLNLLKLLRSWIKRYGTELWLYNYNLCLDYEDKFGCISDDTIHLHVNIGSWLNKQRRFFRKSSLSLDQKKNLKMLRSWKIRRSNDEIWEEKFQICKNYEILYNGLSFSKSLSFIKRETVFNQVAIGAWLMTQKLLYKNNLLTNDKCEKLKTLCSWQI